jgi:hypothetical protein
VLLPKEKAKERWSVIDGPSRESVMIPFGARWLPIRETPRVLVGVVRG